jgi:hypothetical protein
VGCGPRVGRAQGGKSHRVPSVAAHRTDLGVVAPSLVCALRVPGPQATHGVARTRLPWRPTLDH